MTAFTVQVEMLSDWHIGTGAGDGVTDRRIRRDHDDLPMVPAKTLTGIWRDACEQVAAAFDGSDQTRPWSAWVDELFGSQPAIGNDAVARSGAAPIPARLSVRPARLSPNFRSRLVKSQAAAATLTFLKPGVAIATKTGSAKPNYLRFEEMGRVGTRLVAEVEIDESGLDGRQVETARSLLVAGALFVERIGGKRRRGAGRCRLVISGLGHDVSHVQSCYDRPADAPDRRDASSASPGPLPQSAESKDWMRILVTAELLTPLVVNDRTTANVVRTRPIIPGTYLLPLALRAMSGAGIDLGASARSGDLVVTDLRLAIGGEPSLPVPASHRHCKGDRGLHQGTVRNVLASRPDDLATMRRHTDEWYLDTAVTPTGTQATYARIELGATTHNTVEDSRQRPTTDAGGGVYTYEHLRAGQVFAGEIRLPSSLANQLPTGWQTHLEGRQRLGRSKKDDYGLVQLKVMEPQAVPPRTPSLTKDRRLVLWLLSDLLVRDVRLRPSTDVADVARLLEDELSRTSPIALHVSDVLVGANRQESWQRSWNLPRPSMVGLDAGSVIVFAVDGSVESAQLTDLEIAGIGERTAEGYGQIRFEADLVDGESRLDRARYQPDATARPSEPLTDDELAYAAVLDREALRQAISDRTEEVANDPDQRQQVMGFERTDPGRSQLGALRQLVGRLHRPTGREEIEQWLDHLEKTDNRRDKWPKPARERIRKLLLEDEPVWDALGINIEPSLSGQSNAERKAELWAETTHRLVAACAREHVAQQEQAR